MAQTWTNARMRPVYYRLGKFDSDQKPRFMRAPFDAVWINGELHLQPIGSEITPAEAAHSVLADAEQAQFVRESFYTDLDPIVVEEHQLGCKDDSESWKGVHFFGQI